VTEQTHIELAVTRTHNYRRHNNSSRAGRIQYMGSHAETFHNLRVFLGKLTPGMAKVNKEGAVTCRSWYFNFRV
jgi:hypothetical protein